MSDEVNWINLAQRLAGDDYRVVPRDLTVGDLQQIARDAGVKLDMDVQFADDHSRYTYDATCPKCAEVRILNADRRAMQAAHAQPDRPEPVDPASVRIGDVVEIEADDGSWMVRGRVDYVNSGDDRPICISVPFNYGQIWPKLNGSTVRVLHAAEPEPDKAAVEALRRIWQEAAKAIHQDDFDDELFQRELVRRGVQVVNTDA